MDDYRKRAFRGAKIEDCILDFERMRKSADKKADNSRDESQRRFYDGMSMTYQLVVNRLVTDFDYRLEEPLMSSKLEMWISNFERMAQSCTEQSIKSLDLSVVPNEIRRELTDTKQHGLFEGMALGYQLIANHLKIEAKCVKAENGLDDLVKKCVSVFEQSEEQYKKKASQTNDEFAIGFFEGLGSSYSVALKQLNSEL